MNARLREAYRAHYDVAAEYYLRSAARFRAASLGAKIGRRRPIQKTYRRAVHAPVLLCYWCKKVTFPGERHVDHIVPLSAGGAHVAGNLCIACASCNLAKGDAMPAEFRRAVADKRVQNAALARLYYKALAAPAATVGA